MRYPIRSHSAGGREGGCRRHNRVIPILQTHKDTQGVYAHTLDNRENICSSPAACARAMLLVGRVWRETDCIWVYECEFLFVRNGGGGNVQQETASLTLQQRANGYCMQRHPYTNRHTSSWLWLVSHMADSMRSVTLGYSEDGYWCHLIEKRKRGGMALLSVSCRKPSMWKIESLVLRVLSDVPTTLSTSCCVELKATVALCALNPVTAAKMKIWPYLFLHPWKVDVGDFTAVRPPSWDAGALYVKTMNFI